MTPNTNIYMQERCNDEILSKECNLLEFDNICTLPNKYAKLMCFGFWLLSQKNISDNIRDACFDKLKLFENASEQIDFYEGFQNEEKETAKAIRKLVKTQKENKAKQSFSDPKEYVPKGRDGLLRDVYIDKLISNFTNNRTNNFQLHNSI